MQFKYKLGFIGFGNMANAIYNGIVSKGIIEKNNILIYDIDEIKMTGAKNRGLLVADSNKEIMALCEYVVFAVKPQHAAEILSSLKSRGNVIISIMAGIKKQIIKKFLPDCYIVRCMPNSPAMIGMGMTALDCFGLPDNKKDFVFNIFSAVGEIVEIKEDLMNAVTSVSGSGPAYVYLFLDALIKAGVKNGLSFEESKKLSIQTLSGSAEMVKQSSENIEDLITAVCSKGGTTIKAVKVFKEKNFEKIIEEAVMACFERAKELSE